MLEETLFSLDMPYRDAMEVRAFSFGMDESGHVLGEGCEARDMAKAACVVGGLRGDEVQQTFVCSALVERLSAMERRGDLTPGKLIMVVPCVNPASMAIGKRFWPADRTDINRMFPGLATGETTQRIAAALFERAKGFAYGIHLSSFYLEGDFVPHVRVMHGPGEAANHGMDFGLPYVTHYEPGSFDTATLHYNWRQHGTEAYTFFAEQTTVVDEASAREAVRSLLDFMGARGLVRQMWHGGYRPLELAERALVPVLAPVGGVHCPLVSVGGVVERGQELGCVRDLLRGGVLATMVAPCDGVVFYKARTPLVNEQALAFQVVPADTRGIAWHDGSAAPAARGAQNPAARQRNRRR